ncbi:MAG: DUF3795 domain-containing protein [Saccharofermentanales bacterium]
MNISTCGINCDLCKHKEENGCIGCRNNEGNSFWGKCELYSCAAGKQLLHCGFCDDFPCEKLIQAHVNEGSNGIELLTELMKKQSLVQSRCGLMCNGCEYRVSCGCGGCIETNGHPFHGACPVAKCCQNKGLSHCGECNDMPCEQLYAYSCLDKEHGDKPCGARLSVLRYWKKMS